MLRQRQDTVFMGDAAGNHVPNDHAPLGQTCVSPGSAAACADASSTAVLFPKRCDHTSHSCVGCVPIAPYRQRSDCRAAGAVCWAGTSRRLLHRRRLRAWQESRWHRSLRLPPPSQLLHTRPTSRFDLRAAHMQSLDDIEAPSICQPMVNNRIGGGTGQGDVMADVAPNF